MRRAAALAALAALLAPLLAPGPAGLARAQAVDDSARAMLLLARGAVERGRPAEAREALERAETRLLNRGAADPRAAAPAATADAAAARYALDRRDRAGARAAIARALAVLDATPLRPAPPAAAASVPVPAPPAAASPLPPIAAPPSAVAPAPEAAAAEPLPAPAPTWARRAGRWELRSAEWAWVPPDRAYTRVDPGRAVPGRWVWRGDAYRWEPGRVVSP